jgi:hypothetical protein
MRLSSIKGLVAHTLEADVNRRASASAASSVVGRAATALTEDDVCAPKNGSTTAALSRSGLRPLQQPSRREMTGAARNYHHDAVPSASVSSVPPHDPRRNRFTHIFGEMMDDAACRRRIERYADCVKAAQQHKDEGLTKHACQAEFDAVKDCWRRARKQLLFRGRGAGDQGGCR